VAYGAPRVSAAAAAAAVAADSSGDGRRLAGVDAALGGVNGDTDQHITPSIAYRRRRRVRRHLDDIRRVYFSL